MICDANMWQDLWNLAAKYGRKVDSWDNLVKDIDNMSKKYKDTFCNCVLLAMLDDLEQRSKIAAGQKPKHDDVRVAQFYKQLIKGAFDAETP